MFKHFTQFIQSDHQLLKSPWQILAHLTPTPKMLILPSINLSFLLKGSLPSGLREGTGIVSPAHIIQFILVLLMLQWWLYWVWWPWLWKPELGTSSSNEVEKLYVLRHCMHLHVPNIQFLYFLFKRFHAPGIRNCCFVLSFWPTVATHRICNAGLEWPIFGFIHILHYEMALQLWKSLHLRYDSSDLGHLQGLFRKAKLATAGAPSE